MENGGRWTAGGGRWAEATHAAYTVLDGHHAYLSMARRLICAVLAAWGAGGLTADVALAVGVGLAARVGLAAGVGLVADVRLATDVGFAVFDCAR